MTSNAELMRAAETILAQEDTQSHHWNPNSPELTLARHVKFTLAPDQGEQAIDEKWLREIGFRVVSRWPHSVTAKEHPMFQHRCGISFIPETSEWTIGNHLIKKQETRHQLLSLLSALGIDTTTTVEG